MSPRRFWLTEEDRNELAEMRRAFRGEIPRGAEIPEVQVPRGGKGGGGYFVLAEDADNHPVKMYEGELGPTGAVSIKDPPTLFDLYYVNAVLRTPKKARAGYSGLYILINGNKVFVGNACINSCDSTASITGSPSDGTVDVAYSYNMTFTGIDGGGVTADNLPPGLTLDATSGLISGTPTTAGTYDVRFVGNSTDSPSCPISRIYRIVITEGE